MASDALGPLVEPVETHVDHRRVDVKTVTYEVPLRTRFRGITRRSGMLLRGPAGWGEWSPFPEYERPEIDAWRDAAIEAAVVGWPDAVRSCVPVNSTVPAVDAERAGAFALAGGCSTAKVKVAERGQALADDLARVEAVRDALGASGKVRVDANGGWSVDEAVAALRELSRFELEYAEQPCASVEELAELRVALARAGVDVPIAADESIRRSGDPERVVALDAADVAVLKVQPLGGVRRCLELAELLGLPVVVSSALETSVGIAAGVALAAALPELPYACGLNTVSLLEADVVAEPLVAVDGALPVRRAEPVGSSWRAADALDVWWQDRWSSVSDEDSWSSVSRPRDGEIPGQARDDGDAAHVIPADAGISAERNDGGENR